jgi:hypothetical protein
MRCPSCGYISFDYLDRCVKCSAALTDERHRLNLPETKPNPISLQEIMERMPIITQKGSGQEPGEATIKAQGPGIFKAPEIDLSQGLSMDISIPSDPKAGARESKVSSPKEGELELTLEGFELNSNPEKKGK